MATNPTITYVAKVGSQIRIGFKLAPSGLYVAGGDIVNLATAAADPLFVGAIPAVEALGPPLSIDIWSNGGNITTVYVPVLGTNPSNSKVKGYSALTTEFTGAAAYPASALADTIVGEATFNNL
jgi:hypothetical protein